MTPVLTPSPFLVLGREIISKEVYTLYVLPVINSITYSVLTCTANLEILSLNFIAQLYLRTKISDSVPTDIKGSYSSLQLQSACSQETVYQGSQANTLQIIWCFHMLVKLVPSGSWPLSRLLFVTPVHNLWREFHWHSQVEKMLHFGGPWINSLVFVYDGWLLQAVTSNVHWGGRRRFQQLIQQMQVLAPSTYLLLYIIKHPPFNFSITQTSPISKKKLAFMYSFVALQQHIFNNKVAPS